MRMIRNRLLAGGLLLACGLLIGADAWAQAPQMLIDEVSYREIGPTAQGGRFVDFAAPTGQPGVFYAATASGGLWKTINHGLTFTSMLDETGIISLGSVAVAPTDPNTVWIGTGEGNNSRSVYYGDGVYKSTDGGETWTNMGLKESHHVSRIVVDPRNAEVVYVAANGHLYSENEERGLYKTTDGGSSWQKVLDVKSEGRAIGVIDVVLDPRRPNTVYAAAYDKVRLPWTFNDAGPGSGIWKSTNGGRTWNQLGGGLPAGMLGRIGLTIYPKDPSILYAVIENSNSEGVSDDVRRQELLEGRPPSERVIGIEVYRTDNGGSAWKKVNERGSLGGTPGYYYGQIIVDPNDPDRVFNLGTGVVSSTDGGVSWGRGFRFGGDNHALWIDPDNSQHMLLGHDHGMGVTWDGGENWYHPDDLPLAQFYAIGFDMAFPYNVYGGLQDNGSWRGPSTHAGNGPIRFEEWVRVGGGDGMFNEIDPNNPDILYNESQFGPLRRTDQRTGEGRSIRYRGEDLRFNWNAPILVSPHDSDVIYHGANILLKSDWRGESWVEVSPDLTTNDEEKIRGIGNIQYCTITAIDESPITPGVLLVGTDDGNFQMSSDGGTTWNLLNDRIPGWPGYWVSRVVASYHDTSTAYVTVTGMRRDDFRPFVWKTSDGGQSWMSITGDLPNESVNVIREDRKNPDLLFVGTDRGVYTSLDAGGSWHAMRGDMPAVPVHDLKIQPRENDLIVGTHGRGVFITDITPLQEATPTILASAAHLFRIEPKVRWRSGPNTASSSHNFAGESEPNGVTINFWLGRNADAVRIQVYAGARLIKDLEGETQAGLQSVQWNMQGLRPRTPEEKEQYRQRQRRGRGGQGAGQQGGPPAGGPPPGGFGGAGQRGGGADDETEDLVNTPMPDGEYRVVLVVDGRRIEGTAVIMPDHWWQNRP